MELLHKPGESIAHNQGFGLFFHAVGEQVASRGDKSFSEDEQSRSFRRLVLGKSNLWLGA